MEKKDKETPPEVIAAALSVFFDKESKKISTRLETARSIVNGVDTNGAVVRKRQQILHLEERQAELDHISSFVLKVITSTTQTSEIPSIGYYFVGKLDEIDLEIKRIQSHPHGVIFEQGVVKGRSQELKHLAIIRSDMLRVGNYVLGLLGEPPLVDEKNPATV